MSVIYPSDEFLPPYREWEPAFSLSVLERDYEDDYPEDLYDEEDYYPGYGDYVVPEMDCE